MRRSNLNLMLITVALTGAMSAHAEISRKLTLNEKVVAADEILHAQVMNTTTEWRNGKVFTTSSLNVIEDLKGGGTQSVEVLTPGGTAVHPVLKVPVTTRLSNGVQVKTDDEVILFARRDNAGQLRLVAGKQTYMRLAADADGATRVYADERRVQAKPGQSSTQAADSATDLDAEVWVLDDFKSRIRREVAAARTEAELKP